MLETEVPAGNSKLESQAPMEVEATARGLKPHEGREEMQPNAAERKRKQSKTGRKQPSATENRT